MSKLPQKINEIVGEPLAAPAADATTRCKYRFVLVQMGGSGKQLPYEIPIPFK